MLRALIRTFLRGVLALVLFASILSVYLLYRSGNLPFVQKLIDDAALVGSVKAAYAIHRDLSLRSIGVEADAGNLVLTGGVRSEAERREAEALAESVEGVLSVDNRLKVDSELPAKQEDRRSLGERLDDVALLAKVRAALRLDRQTAGLDIEVQVREGTVRLSGSVPSEELRTRVRERVGRVEGVSKLEDELELAREEEGG